MATTRRALGAHGEDLVARTVSCPGCKSPSRTLRLLPANFKCADLICDFCGYLAQVKTTQVATLPNACPPRFMGAAWGPQSLRMESGIFFSLFLVVEARDKSAAIFFLPRDLQTRENVRRASTAERHGEARRLAGLHH